MIPLLRPEWAVPKHIQAAVTTRQGGVSAAPYASLNLGTHVGDLPAAVTTNRARVKKDLKLPSSPLWLSQVHGTRVVRTHGETMTDTPESDASYTATPGVVLAIMTADCLPLLLTNRDGTEIAVAHCGWKGIAGGLIRKVVAEFESPAEDIIAWMGPAIGPSAFEVGDDVRRAMMKSDAGHQDAFQPFQQRWLADIYQLVRHDLALSGVREVTGGDLCTVSDSEQFFSYRRDGVTGRMGSFLWIQP
ncbi:MAG: peptidoglycan editing factor PgeF [Idiomarina sp.]|nr:peptidoglycan editing factor PgeF [Idiomarina sp.]